MPGSLSTRRSRLCLVAEEIGTLHAEVGDVRAHGYLAAALDALAHALVDLSDGLPAPTTVTPVSSLPGRSAAVVPSSCAATAAALRRARADVGPALAGADGIPDGFAADVLDVLDDLAETLQWLAGTGADTVVAARLHRDLRRAHRRLQPAGTVQL